MHGFRRLRFTAPATLALLVSLYPALHLCAQSGLSGPAALHFLFAVGAQLAAPGSPKPVPVETQTVLNSGDRIKFFLEPKVDAYFYLFHLGPQGHLSLLFPPDLKKTQAASGQPFYVPEGPLWYELDATSGMEKFFLLASKSRLSQIESLYARHVTLTDREDIQSSTQAILDEVGRLTQQRKSLAAPAEKPIRIAGKQRGPQAPDSVALPDITPFAKEILAQGFYSKTFTIDHR
jgi:hypothetical protein